jgi:hypothetical protein
MDLPCAVVAKRDLYRRPHVTYISEKVGHSDIVFRGWCGVDKRYQLVKFDGHAMCVSDQKGMSKSGQTDAIVTPMSNTTLLST